MLLFGFCVLLRCLTWIAVIAFVVKVLVCFGLT